MSKKTYTISTLEFSSLDEVKEQLHEWAASGLLKPGTKVFEIKREVSFDIEVRTEIKI